MNRTISKVISVILSIAMVFSLNITGIQTAFAAGVDETEAPVTQSTDNTNNADVSQDYQPVTLESLVDEDGFLTDEGLLSLKELPYDGEKYTEIVDNGDGTQTLRQYTEPIKFENEEGEYEDIDTSIEETSSDNGSENTYGTVASDVEVQMSDNLNQSDAIQVTYDDYNIGFQPQDVLTENGESSADVGFIEAESEVPEEHIEAVDDCESVVYSDTFEDSTDIVITPTSTGVKEDIVLNEIPTVTEYSYKLTVDGVIPILRRDGNLYFVDLQKGMIVAAIPIPVMYDSTPESGTVDIPVTLEKTEENTYEYTLYPDTEFLKTAMYPVVIDPSVSTQTGGVYDTYVKSTTSTNYCNDADIRLGRDASGNKYRGLIQLSPAGLSYIQSKISGCRIDQVKYWAYENYSGASSPTVQLYPITSSWEYNTVKWGNQPSITNVPMLTSQMVTSVNWYYWDITSIGRDWVGNTTLNYGQQTFGILLKNDNETLNMYKRFNSDQATSNRDYFEFIFTDTIAPPLPTNFRVSNTSFSGPTGSITVSWSGVTDLPADYASGLNHYELGKWENGGWTFLNVGLSTAYAYTGCPDNAGYNFAVRAWDNNGNVLADWSYIWGYYSPDCTGPEITGLGISVDNPATNGYTADKTPTLSWTSINDEGNHLSYLRLRIDNGTWQSIGLPSGTTYTLPENMVTSDGAHTLYLQGVDSSGNAGSASSVAYYRDTTAPIINNGDVTLNYDQPGIIKINATITNSSGSGFGNWVLDYGPGNPAASFCTPSLASGTTAVNNQEIYQWDTTKLPEEAYYTLRLRAYDALNNEKDYTITLFISSKSEPVIAGIDITSPAQQPSGSESDGYDPDTSGADYYTISSPQTSVVYEQNGGGTASLEPGYLYANNEMVDSEATAGEGLAFDATTYDADTKSWVYPEGSLVYLYVQANDGNGEPLYSTGTRQSLQLADPFNDSTKIDLSSSSNVEVVDGRVRLTSTGGVYASQGVLLSTEEDFAGYISYIDLIVNQSVPEGAGINYEVSVDGGLTWNAVTPVSTDGGATSDLTKRLYFTTIPAGDSVTLRATLTKSSYNLTPSIDSWSINVRYTTYVNAVLVNNTFEKDARGMTELVNTYHDETEESITLAKDTETTYYTEGTIQSTERYASTDITKVCLEVDENLEDDTNIVYHIFTLTDSGWMDQIIEPGNASEANDWVELDYPGKVVYIQAVLSTEDTSNTPHLNKWRLCIEQEVAGDAYIVKLVDEPWNLSTLTDANYMTLLRWEASETANETEGVTYNVYRSTTPYFVPSDDTRVAKGITETSWSDYNLNFGQTFYYKVTAVLDINGHERISLPSNEDFATVVSEAEFSKHLGLQDYWSYSGFTTGSGTGYVNVSNGNLVYTATDMVVSDPFLAMVMRRTYNSLADSKTPMGYGWDYSFNTCLMALYSDPDEDGIYDTQAGMILKDGDGSFHFFEKDGTSYKSAPGTFMNLERVQLFDEEGQPVLNALGEDVYEYQITRKDNIVYHFDEQSMKLKSFSDNNGNELKFRYDSRGNIDYIENTVGDKLTFTYYANGCENEVTSGATDYIYVNEHADMLKTVKWTEDTDTDRASITYTYTYDDDDRLISASTTIENSNVYEELFSYDDTTGDFTITDPEGKQTVISYSVSGKVDEITDANGDAYSFSYLIANGYGITQNVTTMTNKYGASIQYKYNGSYGYVYEMIDASGESIYYEHNDAADAYDDVDDASLVTGMSYSNYVGDGTSPETISYSYTYIDGNIHSISGPDGSSTVYGDYNSFNKPLSATVATSSTESGTTTFHYDDYGNVDYEIDPEGKRTTYNYDYSRGGLLTSKVTDEGGVTAYTYDAKGRVISIAAKIDGIVQSQMTYAYDYNEDGYFLRITTTDGLGNSTYTYYNQLGRNVKTVYADGSYTTTEYNLCGTVKVARNAENHETRYTYNNLYQMIGATYADGSTNSIEYYGWDIDGDSNTGDSHGWDGDMVIGTDGTGVKTIQYYLSSGRLFKTATSYVTMTTSDHMTEQEIQQYLAQIIQNQVITARYVYDLIGNCVKVTDNAGRVSEAEYNALGQQTKIIVDPTGENIVTNSGYDLLGNLTSVTDGEGYTTSYTYDSDLRLSTVVQIDNKGTTDTSDDETLTTSYSYDNTDAATGYHISRVTDAEGHVTETWFDDLGRKVKELNVGTTGDSEEIVTTYTYNANSQLALVTRNDGTKEKYTYNSLGQVSRIDYYEELESTATDSDDYIVYAYDDNGNLTAESVYHGTAEETTEYAYDELGRVRQVREGDLNNGGLNVTYYYDDADRVHYITYAKAGEARTLEYDYDSYGRIQYIKLALGDTPTSADDTVSGAETVRQYIYKANGDIDRVKDYRNFNVDPYDYVEIVYTLNSAGLTTGITYTDYEYDSSAYTDSVKETYTMTYDDRGYIQTENSDTYYGTEQSADKTYTYDSIGRLVTSVNETTSDGSTSTTTTTYTYDNVGNRLTMSDGTDSYAYTYNQFNQLTGVTKNSQFEASYTYDDRGNQTQEIQHYVDVTIGSVTTSCNQTTNYTYDLMNSLTGTDISTPEVDGQGTVTYSDIACTYAYNAAGQRIKKVENDSTTKYYYSGGAILYTASANSYLLTENILDLGGNIIASARFEDETPDVPDDYYFYHYDMRGSVTAIVKPDGTLTTGYSYDEFGNLEQTGDTGFLNEVTFTGSVTDTSTGLQYMNSRYYDSSTGRFLTQDTYSGNPYDPWTQHLYSYCGNNPTSMIDPTGHSWLSGLSWLSVGLVAIAVGVTILTAGAAAPLAALAITAVAAGTLTAVNGVAEIGDEVTGYNFVKDGVFSGNQNSYNNYSTWTNAVAYSTSVVLSPYTMIPEEPNVGATQPDELLPDYGNSGSGKSGSNSSSGAQQAQNPSGYNTAENPSVKITYTNSGEPLPPGWTDEWTQMWGTRDNATSMHWFDTAGGEWRWHAPDSWHDIAHWDYNPWRHACDGWQNMDIYGNRIS